MEFYSLDNWFWIVGDDETRAWSSADSAYVTDWPAGRVTNIRSVSELDNVLVQHGLIGPSGRYKIEKLTLVNRIATAGLLVAVDDMFAASVTSRHQWGALPYVLSDNQTIRDTLDFLGGDLNVLLAPETE